MATRDLPRWSVSWNRTAVRRAGLSGSGEVRSLSWAASPEGSPRRIRLDVGRPNRGEGGGKAKRRAAIRQHKLVLIFLQSYAFPDFYKSTNLALGKSTLASGSPISRKKRRPYRIFRIGDSSPL